jgi:hypothetical protein
MKRLNIAVCGLMFAAATAMLVSCQDIVTYNDGYDDGMTSNGVPSISAIYRADDTEMTAPLTGAAFEDMIKLTGENLSHAKKVMLNEITDRSGIVERIAVGGVYFELEPIVRRIGGGFGRDVTSSAQQAVPTPCGIRSFDAEIRTVQRSGFVGTVSGSNQFGSRPEAVDVGSVQVPKNTGCIAIRNTDCLCSACTFPRENNRRVIRSIFGYDNGHILFGQ